MPERTTDLRAGLAVLRRRWYFLVTAAILGLGAGVLYSTVVPAPLGSKALVLLSSGNSSSGDGDAAIMTQVQIVLSTPVLTKAGEAVTPRLSAAAVKDLIQVDAATSQLIQIQAFSPRVGEAQALAQAVAVAYRDMLQDTAKSVSGAIVGDLKKREDALVQQISDVLAQIQALDKRSTYESPTSSAGIKDAQLRAALTAAQADLVGRLNDVKSDLAATGVSSGGSSLASIVQPATPATGPGPLLGLITWGAAGALLGAAAAAALVAVRDRRDPRLRARDDMADAVGSSVLADVRSRPQRSLAEWSALFETYTASPVDAWAFRQLLRALAALTDGDGSGGRTAARGPGRLEHPTSLLVMTLSGDRRGLALAPQLAAFATSLGLTTRFIVARGDRSAASLRAACSVDRASQLRPGLQLDARTESVGAALPAEIPEGASFDDLLSTAREIESPEGKERAEELHPVMPQHASPDLTVVLAVMDSREPTLDGVQPTAVTVLAVAPGVGTREDLARLAVAVDDAGRRIDGIVVADPDPADRTTGRRTLDERARQAPLPLRVTGIGQPIPRSERG